MYDFVNKCMEIAVDFGQGYCLQYFFGEFLKKRKSDIRFLGLLITFVYGILRFITGCFMEDVPDSAETIVKPLICLLYILLLSVIFYKGRGRISIFLAVTFLAVCEISFFLSYMIIQIGNYVYELWIQLVERQMIDIIWLERLTQITAWSLEGIFYISFFVLLRLLLKKIAGEFVEKELDIEKTEFAFLLAPGMMGLFISMLLRMIMITVENGVPKLLYDRYPVLTILVPVILLISAFSILYGVRLFQNLIVLEREKSSRVVLEKQIYGLQEYMKEMERVYAGLNGMKHDMKNTISVILRLAGKREKPLKEGLSEAEDFLAGAGEDDAELRKYLLELNRTFDRLEYRFKTGNHVVDALLNMKYYEGKEIISDLDINADRLLFPNNLLIQSFDLGIIMGNAIDNAIEACMRMHEGNPERKTFIRLTSYRKGQKENLFFIEIENSYDGKLIQKNGKDFPESDKADKKKHGLGFMNMQKIAEKYHGGVDWMADGQTFTLTVMLKNSKEVKGDLKHGF